MAGRVTVINDPSEKKPEMRQVVADIVQSIEEVRPDGYEIRILFVKENQVTVSVDPIGMSADMKNFFKFLDRVSNQCARGPMMTEDYFSTYFCSLFTQKARQAFHDAAIPNKFDYYGVNTFLREQKIPYKVVMVARETDPKKERFYTLLEVYE